MPDSSEKNYARIFVAFPIPSQKAEELKIIQQQNNSLPGIRWTRPENLHVTIFFLGEISKENISPVIKKIKVIVEETFPFNLQFEKIKLAGKLKRSGMIWAEFHKNDSFTNLSNTIHQSVDSFLLTQPILKDPIPHITLARLKGVVKADKINLSFHSDFTVPEINFCELWKTNQTKNGVIYESLQRFYFQK